MKTNKHILYCLEVQPNFQFIRVGLLLLLVLFISLVTNGQSIVVSEYYNDGSNVSEWTELLVIQDNLDLRGYYIRDNNTSQDNWQDSIIFSNHPYGII